VTHYPLLSRLQLLFPTKVGNYHMAFLEQYDGKDKEGESDDALPTNIMFLYKTTKGAAKKSYGLNVARLAGLPAEILQLAAKKSHSLEKAITQKQKMGRNDNVHKMLVPLLEEAVEIKKSGGKMPEELRESLLSLQTQLLEL